jgi:hypothetical protein
LAGRVGMMPNELDDYLRGFIDEVRNEIFGREFIWSSPVYGFIAQ